MSIFDGDKSPINIPFPTMGGLFFWEELDCQKGYKLQLKKILKNYNFYDEYDEI